MMIERHTILFTIDTWQVVTFYQDITNESKYVEQGPSFTEEFQGIKTNLTQIPLKI